MNYLTSKARGAAVQLADGNFLGSHAVLSDFSAMKKRVLWVLVILAAAWLGGCAAIYAAMRQPPESFGRVMAHIPGPVAFLAFPFESLWMRARAGELKPGDQAPDFSLGKVDKSGPIQLSAFSAQHRPVVLIFGSYT
jgi:hypothetical protein